MGIISGFSDNTIKPEQELTREELAVIIKNILNKIAIGNIPNEQREYKDATKISKWADDAIQINTSLGIITGYPDNTFKPQNKVTRAETTVIIDRLLNIAVSE